MRYLFLVFLAVLVSSAASAQTFSLPQWQTSNWYRNTATLDLDFVHDRYWLNGTPYSGVANFISGAGATFTRAGTTNVTSTQPPFYTSAVQSFVSRGSSATYFDNTGTLQTAATGAARNATYSYNGSAWVANTGTLIEPAATNGIRNNTMVGAVAADGVERSTNGTFGSCSGTTCTGWTKTTAGTATVSFASNTATLTGDGTNAASIYQAITTISGYTYTIAVTLDSSNAATVQAGTSAGGATLLAATAAGVSATTSIQFIATGTTSYVQINNTSATAANVTLVSVQSAGKLPANWSILYAKNVGLLYSVMATGVASGMSYVDINLSGTTTASGTPSLFFDTGMGIAAANGQVWAESLYLAITAGSLTNITNTQIGWYLNNSSGIYLTSQQIGFITINSTLSRYTNTAILNTSNTGYIDPYLFFLISSVGSPVNLTFRVGMPQLEQNSYATSVIATSGSAITRSADVYQMPNGGTYFDSSGTMQTAAANTPRLDYGQSGGNYPLGILIEESRTNSIKNSSFTGAIAGSPGSVTGWGGFGTSNGMTTKVTGSGTEFGMPYLEVNVSGTNSSGATAFPGVGMSTPYVATSPSVAWTDTVYARVVGGTLPAGFQLYTFEYNSSSAYLGTGGVSFGSLSTTTPQKLVLTATVGINTAYVAPNYKILFTTGQTGNVTIRFYAPQLELGSFPTSFIPTYGSAVTRALESFSVLTTAAGANGVWYNVGGFGTLGVVGEYDYLGAGQFPGLASLWGSGSSNSIDLYTNQAGSKTATIYSGGSLQFSTNIGGTYTAGNQLKQVIAFAPNDVNADSDGVVVGTSSITATIPTVTNLNVGADTNNFYGIKHVGRIWYMPTRQPDSTLSIYTK